MDIKLNIINHTMLGNEQELTLPLTANGLMIGRRPDNDLCLDDPDLVISGNHARLDWRADALWVTDISRNGTYLNGSSEPLPSQQSVSIQDGDRLSIGHYEITVHMAAKLTQVPATDCDPFSMPLHSEQSELTDLMPSGSSTDILDLIASGTESSPAWREPNLSAHSQLAGAPPAALPPEAAQGHTPIESLFCQPSEPVAPEEYDLLNDVWSPPVTQSTAEKPIPAAATLNDSPPFLSQPSATQPPFAPELVADSRLTAFLAGLGRSDSTQQPLSEDILHQSGELLRALAAGLAQIMLGRTQFKSELRLGVTTIRAIENNPFKFSVDADDLLERLLFRPTPGFLPAVIAARDAFDDIQAHEMAMTAGLQAALRALLARFEPAELERRLSQRSGLDQVLPMARKAKYWDLFTETYQQVAADAAEDFMQLFGDAFAKAYEEQIRRLREARSHGPRP